MLMIPRALVRSFRAVMRRCLFEDSPRNDWPVILVRSDGQQTVLESARGSIAVRFSLPGPGEPGAIAFRASVLAELEGRTTAAIIFKQVATGQGVARWEHSGVPREQALDTVNPDSLPPLPELPREFVPMPDGFLQALGEAALTTAKVAVRYALQQVQLSGKDGAIVATDGKQLLIQTGFPFPWRDTVLVPRLRLDGLPGVRIDAPVTLGRSATHVVLQFADWTFFLRTDDKARYPQVAEVLPRQSASTARWHLAAEDIGRLAEILPNLPGHDVDETPVTVDLGEVVTVRGRGTSSGPAVEATMANSTTTGTPLRFAADRHYLLRALQLGFTELAVARPNAPVVCRDATRTYGWMVLDKSAVVLPDPKMIRLHVPESSIPEPVEVNLPEQESPESRSIVMPSPSNNGHSSEDRSPVSTDRTGGIEELLSEAESLRQSLSEAATRAARLVGALKLHRRQARAVHAAVSSLQQLRIGSP